MLKRIAAYFVFTVMVAVIVYQRLPETKLPPGVVVDSIVVLKTKRQMLVYAKGELVNTYTVSLGDNPVGKSNLRAMAKRRKVGILLTPKTPTAFATKI